MNKYRATYLVRPVGGISSEARLEFDATNHDKAEKYARAVGDALDRSLHEVDLGGEVSLIRLEFILEPLKLNLEVARAIPIG